MQGHDIHDWALQMSLLAENPSWLVHYRRAGVLDPSVTSGDGRARVPDLSVISGDNDIKQYGPANVLDLSATLNDDAIEKYGSVQWDNVYPRVAFLVRSNPEDRLIVEFPDKISGEPVDLEPIALNVGELLKSHPYSAIITNSGCLDSMVSEYVAAGEVAKIGYEQFNAELANRAAEPWTRKALGR